jgi:hypothetical protein
MDPKRFVASPAEQDLPLFTYRENLGCHAACTHQALRDNKISPNEEKKKFQS